VIELFYNVTIDPSVFKIENRFVGNIRLSMENLVNVLVNNIRANFTDASLAQTIEGKVDGADVSANVYAVIGHVGSTWPDMIYYEIGRPSGKMPLPGALAPWIARKGIKPDPQKTLVAFAYTINTLRLKNQKKAVPVQVLVDWANNKGIVPSEQFAMKSLEYAIGLKVKRQGIPGHFYFQQGLDATRPEITRTFEALATAAP
jgi:hypothetical protein